MCMMNARLSVCVKIVKSGSCEGRRRRPEHKIYRVLHSYYRHHLNQVVTPYLNTPRFLLCRICAIVTLAINQNTVLTSGNAGADI